MRLSSAILRRLSKPTAALVVVDFATLLLSFYLAVALRFAGDMAAISQSVGPLLPRAISFSGWVLLALLSMGLYRLRQRPTSAETVVRVLLAVGLGGMGNVMLFYAVPDVTFGRGVMALGLAIACVALVAARLVVLHVIDANPGKRNVLVIGVGEVAAKVSHLRRRSDRRRFDVVGFVALTDAEFSRGATGRIEKIISLETARNLLDLDEIVVALDERRGALPLEFLLHHKQRGVAVSDIVDFLERETERLDLDLLRPSWLLYEKSSQAALIYRWFKRVLDLAAALVLLVLFLPVALVVVVAMWCEDGISKPVFYRQERVGRNARPFSLLKFRSMNVNAEADTGPRFAASNDSRVTRVGAVLRRFRLDELPQVINVIRGDMSLIGPRPERPEFVRALSERVPLYFYRHSVRPGLTGWAQLNFPYGSSLDDGREKLAYDLYYIKNTNIVFDLLILAQTVEVVVWGNATSMAGAAPGGQRLAERKIGAP